MASDESKSLSDLYPDAHAAVNKAGHLKTGQKLPTFGSVLDKRKKANQTSQTKRETADKQAIHIMVIRVVCGIMGSPDQVSKMLACS